MIRIAALLLLLAACAPAAPELPEDFDAGFEF